MDRNNIMFTKGSVMLIVLIAISLISLIGTTVLSLSVTNFKMKTIDRRVKTAFYLAEAGVEEVYSVIIKEIQKAVEIGNIEVEAELSTQSEDQPLSATEKNTYFQEAYKNYISNNLVHSINNYDYSLLDVSLNTTAPRVEIVEVKDFLYNSDQFILVIEVTHTHERIEKYFKVEYTLWVPEYSIELSDKNSIFSLLECKYIESY